MYISYCGSIVSIPFFWRVGLQSINNILSQISILNKIGYLLLKLKAVLHVVPMVSVKLAVFVFVSLLGFSLDFPRPIYKFFVFDLHEYLEYWSFEGWQY